MYGGGGMGAGMGMGMGGEGGYGGGEGMYGDGGEDAGPPARKMNASYDLGAPVGENRIAVEVRKDGLVDSDSGIIYTYLAPPKISAVIPITVSLLT